MDGIGALTDDYLRKRIRQILFSPRIDFKTMTDHIYAPDQFSTDDLHRLHGQGDTFRCAICKSVLSVALSGEEAVEQGTWPGIRCSKDPSHIDSRISFTEDRDFIDSLGAPD